MIYQFIIQFFYSFSFLFISSFLGKVGKVGKKEKATPNIKSKGKGKKTVEASSDDDNDRKEEDYDDDDEDDDDDKRKDVIRNKSKVITLDDSDNDSTQNNRGKKRGATVSKTAGNGMFFMNLIFDGK